MISRAMASVRLTSVAAAVAGALACVVLVFTLGTTPALGAESEPEAACANVTTEPLRTETEQRRGESNTNPTTGKPYSVALPDCRAYEMVSPLYKQAHGVAPLAEGGFPAAPDGDTTGFASEGDFAEPENYRVNLHPVNAYLSQRCPPSCSGSVEGWKTSSVFAPRNLIDVTVLAGLLVDTSPDLRSVRVSCGFSPTSKSQPAVEDQSVVCALRQPDGSWMPTPTYTTVHYEPLSGGTLAYGGGSADLSHVIIQPLKPLLPTDILTVAPQAGIYEIAGVGTASPILRLVNIDAKGHELVLRVKTEGGEEEVEAPLLGGFRQRNQVGGTAYHAISEDGGTVFFTATPAESAVQTIYARIEAARTVEVSNPTPGECVECIKEAPHVAAAFQGASADGSKVFFTTRQKLLNEDTKNNLYEYDFKGPEGHKLVLLSPDPAGAEVQGVVRTSADGRHVYFVAKGKLTPASCKNCEEAVAGQFNLYGYDTVTGETKFVLVSSHSPVAGVEEAAAPDGILESRDFARHAQTTPDGRYLVFSSSAQLAGDTNIKGCPATCPQAVYRYDFKTGDLTWVSQGAPGFTPVPPVPEGEGMNATIAALANTEIGARANIDDWNRAISENGEYIIFTTAERLQASDKNQAADVYEWHNGAVSMISDGHDPAGVELGSEPAAAMSASGSDIFFSTEAALVGQDTDVLRDTYDARVVGGFKRPPPQPSCPSESSGGCQGKESVQPSFGPAPSSVFTGGQSLGPTTPSVAPLAARVEAPPKKLTRAQLLARALKACKGKPRKKRKLCESQARRKYAGKAKAKTKRAHRRGK